MPDPPMLLSPAPSWGLGSLPGLCNVHQEAQNASPSISVQEPAALQGQEGKLTQLFASRSLRASMESTMPTLYWLPS